MDIREIYRLHQQYSHSPVTIDMGTAEDHAAAPALTYAAGGKRRWDQHKPALKVTAICCAFIVLATIAGLGLGDLYAKKGRAGSAAAAGPEQVTHAVQTQAPAAPASAPEPAVAANQATPAAIGRSKQPRLSPLLGVPSAPHPIKPLLRGPRRHPNQPPRHRAPLHHRHAPRKRIVRPAT